MDYSTTLKTDIYPQNVDIEEILRSLNGYIVRQVANAVGKGSSIAHPAVLDLEIDELAQNVLVKFWLALQTRTIAHPRAYIRRMIYHELSDLLRHREPLFPLPLDEHGELYQGRMLFVPSGQMRDPSRVVEQDRLEQEHINSIVDFIIRLPDRQKQAALWVLKDVARDIFQLEVAFRRFGVDLAAVVGPRTKEELRRFKASYVIVLKKLVVSPVWF